MKYDPLKAYFESVPSDKSNLCLSFKEIEGTDKLTANPSEFAHEIH